MADLEKIALKYTDETYACKAELPRLLGTSMIDFAWVQIADYRRKNARNISLRNVPKFPFFFTETPVIAGKIAEFEEKLSKLSETCRLLEGMESLERRLLLESTAKSLSYLAKEEKIEIGESSIKAIANGTYIEKNEKHLPLLGYFSATKDLSSHPHVPLNEDLLGEIYESILGQNELTVFYRNGNPGRLNSYSQIDRVYEWAPYERIEEAMEELFAYLQNDSGFYFEKAVASLFYIDYIKPFYEHNEAIGSLLCKYILADKALGKYACLLPIERILDKSDPKLRNLYVETQRQNDLTYILLYAISYLTPIIDSLIREITSGHAQEIDLERKRIDEEEAIRQKEEEKEIASAPVEVEVKKNTVVIEEIKEAPIELPKKVSVNVPPPNRMSDKEIKEFARYIRETNPLVRKSQAAFYSTHCAPGRFYTIQDYKRATRCSYETARTSMDNLASLGFYKKMKLKNKFVYTPNKEGEDNPDE